MSIFSSIMNKIFNRDPAGSPEGAAPSPGASRETSAQQTASTSAAPGAAASGAASAAAVDVEGVLSGMAAKAGQQLDWRKSIVDLMKLLNIDSSLAARKELAQELRYTGDTSDSAKMNVWLHKHVMQKLAENGGKVPASLKD